MALLRVPDNQARSRIHLGTRIVERLHRPGAVLAHLENRAAHEPLVLDAPQHGHRHLIGRHPAVLVRVNERHLVRVVFPQRRPYHTRRDRVDADAVLFLEWLEAAYEPVDAKLGRAVQGRVDVGHLARDGPNVHDALWVRRGDGGLARVGGRRRRGRGRGRGRVQPVRHGELRRADGMRQVDVQERIVARVGAGFVAGAGRAGRVPEAGPRGLVDAGAGTHDVDVAEFLERDVKEVRQGGPRGHVGRDKDGARAVVVVAVLGDEPLCFGAETEIGEHDVAVARQQERCEGEVDAGPGARAFFCWRVITSCQCIYLFIAP